MLGSMFVVGITGPTSLVVIAIIALIIFGPTKLPQFGRAIGSTLKEFKSAAEHIDEDSHETPSKASNHNENNLSNSSLIEHFGELRHRLVVIFIAFIISVIIVYISSHWWIQSLIRYIKRAHVTLHTFSFTETIQIYVMIIFTVAICIIIPIIFINSGHLLHQVYMHMNDSLYINTVFLCNFIYFRGCLCLFHWLPYDY